MNQPKPYDSSSNLADQAAHSAQQAIQSTQRTANAALDGLASGVQELGAKAAPMLERAQEQASAIAQRSVDAMRDSTRQLRDQAQHASEVTTDYVRHEPIKAMLMAAACGAALMALVSLLGRSRGND